MVVNGTIDTHNQLVNFNSTNVYAFDGYQNCSSSECTEIKNYSQWNANPSHPGINYLTSGALIFSSSGNFTIPAGITTIKVEAWGAGANGGTGSSGGVGGGGGAYASSVITGLTPGDVHTVTVGAAGSSGEPSSFGSFVVAAGAQGQTGGQASASTGDVVNSGGDGGNFGNSNGGGGGGSAWANAPGNTGGDGSGSTGGAGGDGEGDGGSGGSGNNNSGFPGQIPGGGGGGGGKNASGGAGANGLVIVSWSDLPFIYFTSASTSIIESNTTLNIEVEISSTSTSTVSANFSVTTNIATAGTDFSILTSSPISISPGSTTTTISVQIIDDGILDQFGESVTLTLNNPTNASLGTPVSHTINIIENEFTVSTLLAEYDTVCVNNDINLTSTIKKCGDIYDCYMSTDGGISYTIIAPGFTEVNGNCIASYTPTNQGIYIFYYTSKNNGNSNIVGVTVLGVPEKPGSISGNTTLCPGATGESYSIDPVPGATSYTWTVPTGWSITAGQGSTEITVSTGTTGGTISVVAVNDCGISDNPSTLSVSTQDNEAPAITCPANQTFDANNTGCTYQVIDNSLDASATDNCVIASITHNYNGGGNSLNGESFPVGTTTVTWTARDGGGLEATCDFDITVVNPVSATVSRFSLNNECPELFNNQGFNANSGNYDAGSTKIVFTVTLNSDPSSGWNFDYELTGANIRTGLSGAGIDPYYESSTGNIPVPAGNSSINLTFYVDNDPPVIVEPLLTIWNVSDGNCNNPNTNSESITIKAMPDVGDYE
ncbi:MAG: HYR domain-containing protein [Prolixibacteraceae bacterium]|nr:HYR domain-containing protein [Prolixibacteraceae bacterium]